MSTTLVLPERIAAILAEMARDPKERAAVLLVGRAELDGADRLLGRRLWQPPDSAYADRGPDGLILSSAGWAPALAAAADIGAGALFVHTHPAGDPTPSGHDREVDSALDEPFRIRTGQDLYGSLTISPTATAPGFVFTGHVERGRGPGAVHRLLTVGRRITLTDSHDSPAPVAAAPLFDRQIRAFGGDVQRVLGLLKVGVAGAGGTGSAVLEQLVRLGVRDIVVTDPDMFTDTNVTRVYGSNPADVGRPKVDIQAEHLHRIAPDLRMQTLQRPTTALAATGALTACDIIFGCTDDDAGRLLLARLATYYLTPVIDCGVLLSSTGGQIDGIDGRITTMVPGQACLVCRDRIDSARAMAEIMSTEELQTRQREGYAPELGNVEPAVVAWTSLVASLAVTELLERLTGFGVDPAPSEVLARVHDRELSTTSRAPREGHFCHSASDKMGKGDTEPVLEWGWTA